MRVRTAAPLAVAAVVLAGAAVDAGAAPKPKPITKSYQVTGIPHPNPPSGPSCSSAPEGVSEHRETIDVKGPGKLVVEVTGFTGDWDIGLFGKGDVNLAQGGGADSPNTETAPKETLTYKSKKAQTLFLDVCNFVGSPQANVKYTYTYS
ncbi:MAG TPA: hypothetical protein VF519_12280 [Mycobacteriales bacterium]|jgi:hypothetical protein